MSNNTHIHIGAITALNVFLMWLIVRFLFLAIAQRTSDTPFGQALAYLID